MLNVCLCSQAEMALLMEDDGEDAKQKHFNYDKIVEQQNLSKKKRKKLLKKGEEPLEGDDFQVSLSHDGNHFCKHEPINTEGIHLLTLSEINPDISFMI